MDKMILHWSPRSPFVRKVAVAIREKGLPHRFEFVRSVVPTDDFQHPIFTDNPLGKIPTLTQASGVTWFGSSVILEFLDTLVPEPAMFPGELEARMYARRLEAVGEGVMELMIGWLGEKAYPSARHETLRVRRDSKLGKVSGYLENQVGQINDAGVNAGTVCVAVALSYLDFRLPEFDWRSENPKLASWHHIFSERPSMKQTAFAEG